MRLTAAVALAGAALLLAAAAQNPASRISLALVGAPSTRAHLVLATPAIAQDGAIDPRYSNYGDNRSPPLGWNAVPGAAAYAIVVEDTDAPSPQAFVHWMIWNIPAGGTLLREHVPNVGAVPAPAGAVQGRNGSGTWGYFGPRPPIGSGVHHYHFQIFALDRLLNLPGSAELSDLTTAMKGHVLAKGELVGTYAAPGAQ